jgi:hypothetical protein
LGEGEQFLRGLRENSILKFSECQEDLILSAIATIRNIERARKFKHVDVWKTYSKAVTLSLREAK